MEKFTLIRNNQKYFQPLTKIKSADCQTYSENDILNDSFVANTLPNSFIAKLYQICFQMNQNVHLMTIIRKMKKKTLFKLKMFV